jgi:hypothetical protein
VLVVAVVAVVCAAPILAGGAQLWWTGDYVSQPYFWRSAPEGVDLALFAAGNPFHPLWGSLSQRLYAFSGANPIESTAWLGIGVVIALVMTRKAWLPADGSRPWTWCAVVFLVWAFGPHLLVLGGRTGLLLPELLLRYVPVAANARIPGRAMVMVSLSLSVLLALALSVRQVRAGVLVTLSALILADALAAPIPLTALDRPDIYARLASMPDGTVLEVPFGIRDGFGETGVLDPRTIWYQTIHRKPVVGGFIARMPASLEHEVLDSATLRALVQLSTDGRADEETVHRGRAESAAFFEARSIRYLMLDRSAASPALGAFVTSLPLELVGSGAHRELYVVGDSPAGR